MRKHLVLLLQKLFTFLFRNVSYFLFSYLKFKSVVVSNIFCQSFSHFFTQKKDSKCHRPSYSSKYSKKLCTVFSIISNHLGSSNVIFVIYKWPPVMLKIKLQPIIFHLNTPIQSCHHKFNIEKKKKKIHTTEYSFR